MSVFYKESLKNQQLYSSSTSQGGEGLVQVVGVVRDPPQGALSFSFGIVDSVQQLVKFLQMEIKLKLAAGFTT